ncbi:NnrU family protein [Altererythrobacter sp. GH1-8]|uniref:NnrU family protein n=1 Tax=Altererythrobacter sp. GH1-8 TaxID=3349333 RepID=UPI00374D7896
MNTQLVELVAANIAFVGTHFALSHPLRSGLVSTIGERGFQLLYTAVSFATLYWVVVAYQAAPASDLQGSGEAGWIIASLITIPALVLLMGSFMRNPALPMPGAAEQARQQPRGVFLVTRHPMMWSIALWAASHVILWWNWRSIITALAMGFLALVGAHLQDRKKRALMGEAWGQWQAHTSYWPRWGKLFSVGLLWWALGLMTWVLITYAHLAFGGVPAGIWRWF